MSKKPVSQAGSNMESMMKHISRIALTLCVVITFIDSTVVQGQVQNWTLASTQFIPGLVPEPFQVSPDKRYLLEYDASTRISDLSVGVQPHQGANDQILTDTTTNASRWLNSTVLYTESAIYPTDPAPTCSSNQLLPIGVYNSHTNTQELYCISAPQIVNSDGGGFGSRLERDPFDGFTVLIDERYLVNLKANTLQDLQTLLPTQVSVSDSLQWTAHDRTWWNTQTRLPMARLKDYVQNSETGADDTETIQICPMTGNNCQNIVTIQLYIHGVLGDYILGSDGATLLWAAYQVAEADSTGPGKPGFDTNDLVAFATNIQTGTTSEIFRLSQHQNISTAKGTDVLWSGDRLLAIDMQTYSPSSSMDISKDGLFLASFNGPGESKLLATEEPTETQAKLKLTFLCSDSSNTTRTWQVTNLTNSTLTFAWDIYGSVQRGTGIVAAASQTTFQSHKWSKYNDTARISVNSTVQDIKKY